MKKIGMIIALITVCSACNKFLDVKPKGVVIPEKLADFEGILNSQTMISSFPTALLYCTDDYFGVYNLQERSIPANAYYWRPDIDVDDQASPAIWGGGYQIVYRANIIINNVMNAAESNEQRRKQILGEGLAARAEIYFTMLTAFAKAYNPATAKQDPGLPIVTATNVTEQIPPRASLQDTLDSLVHDLTLAIPMLPEENINTYRCTKYAASGMLSRIYLYMGNYADADRFADSALKAKHALLDYNKFPNWLDLPATDFNPEILWQRASMEYVILGDMLYSDTLKTFFQEGDLRYTLQTSQSGGGTTRADPVGFGNYGITFPELYLTRAEVAARKGNIPVAMNLVNMIRKARFKTDSYHPLTAVTQEEALDIVLAERRRELAYSGQRWTDMKRLDRDGRMPAIKRINKETGAVISVLEPNSRLYTFQIPARVRKFNPGMVIN
ncbi:RagB/SusD family nutrient uptake outer membrane protein [Chitinophaga qingshengii]|uniref:RagB/SusD family nutrient uptake outer membrane protein n=1 Tax=Chitinophaga qingshengii TaxID=1569794 RepID=A0ABR7TNM3_9BACT|nr:RagB/SusD family nutrient uptake outer membrane protein [Chitinophaga qingshengii]MBC9932075.1 RagB/SusD family nutrient uptake outer membrane protein [Chitinophaga qingshengii]